MPKLWDKDINSKDSDMSHLDDVINIQILYDSN